MEHKPKSNATKSDHQTVMVVDDTPENLTVLGEILQPYFRVRVVNSGIRALKVAASNQKPDIILLDVMMPEMDGYEVLARLRENPDTNTIPVIFVTALDDAEDETRGLDLGAMDYITKPIRPSIVLARVRAQLELKQARDCMKHQNTWLEAEVQRRMQENEKIQDASLRALANLAETRDNETGNHILRTQGYMAILCNELAKSEKFNQQLSQQNIAMIVKAAPLHDIGKVGIPDYILQKPGPLTQEEWLIMRTHTVLGAEAIQRAIQHEADQAPFGFFHVAMEIAQHHHEKWDGSGYPAGLSGAAIPLPGRLMALADVFDALITQRVYKPPFSFEQAVDIILDGKGKHFDPEIVDAFLNRVADFKDIAQKHNDTIA